MFHAKWWLFSIPSCCGLISALFLTSFTSSVRSSSCPKVVFRKLANPKRPALFCLCLEAESDSSSANTTTTITAIIINHHHPSSFSRLPCASRLSFYALLVELLVVRQTHYVCMALAAGILSSLNGLCSRSTSIPAGTAQLRAAVTAGRARSAMPRK